MKIDNPTIQDIKDAMSKLTESVVRAARKHKDEPEKVEDYIRRKMNVAYMAGHHVGKSEVTNELFG